MGGYWVLIGCFAGKAIKWSEILLRVLLVINIFHDDRSLIPKPLTHLQPRLVRSSDARIQIDIGKLSFDFSRC